MLVAETYLHSVLTNQHQVEASIARDTLPLPRVEKRIHERAGGGKQARAWAKGEREGQSQREERLQKAAQKRTRATSAWNIYVKDVASGKELARSVYSECMQKASEDFHHLPLDEKTELQARANLATAEKEKLASMPLASVDQTRVSADLVGKMARRRMAIKRLGHNYKQHDSDLRWRGPYGIGDHMGALREEFF